MVINIIILLKLLKSTKNIRLKITEDIPDLCIYLISR